MNKEFCQECGKPIEYQTVNIGDTTKSYRISCECESRQQAAQDKSLIELGTIKSHIAMQFRAGLKARQREMRFQNFTPTEEQKTAFSECINYADGWSRAAKTGLFLTGAVGSGKTHLASSVCNQIIDKYPIADRDAMRAANLTRENISCYVPIRFTTSIELFGRIKASYDSKESGDDVFLEYKNIPLLVIDDIAAEKSTDWTREKLFELFDHRYSECLQTILTTNLTTDELKDLLGTRIIDRIRTMCKLVSNTAPSQRLTVS